MYAAIKTTLLGFTLLSLSSVAFAMPVTFNFALDKLLFLGEPMVFNEGGLELTVSANPGVVQQSLSGLGVKSDSMDSGQIDGRGPDEILSFSFGFDIELLGVWFSRVGYNDDGVLYVDGVVRESGSLPGAAALDLGTGFFDASASNLVGSTFGFGVLRGNDDYSIAAIIVQEIQDVPLPATVTLLCLGLAVLGWSLRKRLA